MKEVNSRHQWRVETVTEAEAESKKEKCPKDDQENPKSKQKEKAHPFWVPVGSCCWLVAAA